MASAATCRSFMLSVSAMMNAPASIIGGHNLTAGGSDSLDCARFLRHRFFQKINTCKFPHCIAVINSVLSCRIRQIKPDLKQVHPQHFFDTHRRTFSFSLGIIRLNYAYPFIPWNNFIHDFKKFFSFCLLFTTAVLNVSKFHHPYLLALLYRILSFRSWFRLNQRFLSFS